MHWPIKRPNLTVLVLLAVSFGVALGYFVPETAVELKVLSDWFIKLIKLFIGPIIFLTVTLGVAGMGSLRTAGRVGFKAILYFEVMTTLALVIGLTVAWLIQPGAGLDPTRFVGADVATYQAGAKAFSWWDFFRANLTLQVLVVALGVGSLLARWSGAPRITVKLAWLLHRVFRALRWVMWLAPLGALGGMAYTVGKFGLGSLLPLGKLMLSVYLTMAVFIFGVLGLVLRWCGQGVMGFLRHIREELLVVLGTSSSEAALPQLMAKLETLGCPRSVVGLVVPAGYSFNLDGTTIYLGMAIMFLIQVYHVLLSPGQIFALIGILAVTSKGAAGVTGSGLVTLASTLMAMKLVPIEGLALLVGVDRFMSEARSITNLIGNGVAALAVAHSEPDARKLAAEPLKKGRP